MESVLPSLYTRTSYSREYSWNTLRMRHRRTPTVCASLYAGMQMYSTGPRLGLKGKLETVQRTSHWLLAVSPLDCCRLYTLLLVCRIEADTHGVELGELEER